MLPHRLGHRILVGRECNTRRRLLVIASDKFVGDSENRKAFRRFIYLFIELRMCLCDAVTATKRSSSDDGR